MTNELPALLLESDVRKHAAAASRPEVHHKKLNQSKQLQAKVRSLSLARGLAEQVHKCDYSSAAVSAGQRDTSKLAHAFLV